MAASATCSCLRALLRHVPVEDLAAAAPGSAPRRLERRGSPARRPRPGAGAGAPAGSTASQRAALVDSSSPTTCRILVDSVTMALARAAWTATWWCIPRSAGPAGRGRGAARGGTARSATSKPAAMAADRRVLDAAHDEFISARRRRRLASSPPATQRTRCRAAPPPELEQELHRVLHDVRVAVEDYPRMQARAAWLADRLAAKGRPAEPSGAAPLADRRTHLPSSATGSTTWWTGRTGSRCSRWPAPAWGSGRPASQARTPSRRCPRGARPARDRRRLHLDQGESRSTVHRPTIWTTRGQAVNEAARSSANTASSVSSRTPRYRELARIPVLRRKLTSALEAAGMTRIATTART